MYFSPPPPSARRVRRRVTAGAGWLVGGQKSSPPDHAICRCTSTVRPRGVAGTWITHRPGHAASAARWQCALRNAWPVARILSERDSWIAAAITGSPHHTGACDAFSESVATTGDAGDRYTATFDPPGTTPSGAPLRTILLFVCCQQAKLLIT